MAPEPMSPCRYRPYRHIDLLFASCLRRQGDRLHTVVFLSRFTLSRSTHPHCIQTRSNYRARDQGVVFTLSLQKKADKVTEPLHT